MLNIASDFSVPTDAITQTFAILAKRGRGKTYTALVIVEEMTKAGLPVCVIDPVGVCWGLRASADGEKPGLPVLVLGGDHGDLELHHESGSAVAEFLIADRRPTVLDLSHFSGGQMTRFVTDFAETLYHKNREPLHLVLDEADAFVPQRAMKGEERMLGAMDKIVRRGRAKGLGITLVSQRPAVIHKNVLTQTECLIVLQMTSPQDRAAIDDWMKAQGSDEQRQKVMDSLATLPVGTAWFWSPAWLDTFRLVKVRERETFDSSKTPTMGQSLKQPKKLAPVDLESLRERFAASIEESRANDPAQLKRRIKELEAQSQGTPAPVEKIVEVPTEVRVEVPVFGEGEVEQLRDIAENLRGMAKDAMNVADGIMAKIERVNSSTIIEPPLRVTPPIIQDVEPQPATPKKPTAKPTTPARKGSNLSEAQQKILNALRAFRALGLNTVSRSNVAVFADTRPTSGGFRNNLSFLRTAGLIDYPQSGTVTLTSDGVRLAQAPSNIATLEQLHQAWYSKLSGPQAVILKQLIHIHPKQIHKASLADLIEVTATSGGFRNNLSALRSLGLIDYPQSGFVVATSLLFPEGLK